MKSRLFPRLTARLFALRAAWRRQEPVRVPVSGLPPVVEEIIPVVLGAQPALVPVPVVVRRDLAA